MSLPVVTILPADPDQPQDAQGRRLWLQEWTERDRRAGEVSRGQLSIGTLDQLKAHWAKLGHPVVVLGDEAARLHVLGGRR